jgi:hypothetical protein
MDIVKESLEMCRRCRSMFGGEERGGSCRHRKQGGGLGGIGIRPNGQIGESRDRG